MSNRFKECLIVTIFVEDLISVVPSIENMVAYATNRSSCRSWHTDILWRRKIGAIKNVPVPFSGSISVFNEMGVVGLLTPGQGGARSTSREVFIDLMNGNI